MDPILVLHILQPGGAIAVSSYQQRELQSSTVPPVEILNLDSIPRLEQLKARHRGRIACREIPSAQTQYPDTAGDDLSLRHAGRCTPNVVFSCELTWRGPCACTGRDKADRQLQNSVRRQTPKRGLLHPVRHLAP